MNSRIKLSARAALSGSQLRIILPLTAILLLKVVFSVFNSAVNAMFSFDGKIALTVIPLLSLALSVVLISPLRLRLEIKHLLLARRIKPAAKISLGLSGVIKSCGMSVCLFVLRLFWLCVFEFVPVSALVIFALYNSKEAISLRAAYAILIGSAVLAFVGLCFYFLFIQRYSKAMFYLACFKDMSVFEAVEESVKKTKKRLADIAFFKLGFLPWFLLCIAVIPALFVIPYYKQSITCYFLNNR